MIEDFLKPFCQKKKFAIKKTLETVSFALYKRKNNTFILIVT